MSIKASTTQFESKSAPVSAYLSLLTGLLVISISPVLLRATDAPGPVSGFYRMTICWVLLTPWFIKHLRERKYSLSELRLPALAGLFFGGEMVLWTSGVKLAGATIPSLFTNTAPLWVGLGALVLFKEKLKPGFWLGLALAFVGAVLIGGVGNSQTEHQIEGMLMGLGAAIFYGGYFLAAQRGREGLDPLSFLWMVSFFSSLVLLVTTIVLDQPLTGYSSNTYLAFLAMGVAVQVVGWQLIGTAQGSLPASLVSPMMLVHVVLAGLLAVPLLGETLTPLEIFGGVMVIVGVYLVQRSKQHEKKA
jgi:drug/metabolite transporter (DMT)-like permease